MADIGYTTTEELQRILKLRAPTEEQQAALVRVLTTSLVEIDKEIDLADDADPLTDDEQLLAAEVQLERSVEHWQQQEAAFGIIGLGSEFGGTHTATDSWNRHAAKLAPLKARWGLA